MIEFIKFDTSNDNIVMGFTDGTTATYDSVTSAQYLIDFPNRAADLKAMGWMQ